MTEQSVNNGRSTEGRDPGTGRFSTGNPGRPPGARNKRGRSTLMRLEDAGEDIADKCVELALAGETTAIRLVLERILPARKDAAVDLDLPRMTSAADAANAMAALVSAVAAGDLAPSEGEAVSRLISTYRRTLEVEDLERRITALEGRNSS